MRTRESRSKIPVTYIYNMTNDLLVDVFLTVLLFFTFEVFFTQRKKSIKACELTPKVLIVSNNYKYTLTIYAILLEGNYRTL